MNNKYFIPKTNAEISAEADTPQDYRNRKGKKAVLNIFNKIILIVAAFVIVTGLANFTGIFDIDNLVNPNVKMIEENRTANETNAILTDIPRVLEKSIFEDLIALIPESTLPSGISGKFVKDKITVYYSLKESDIGEFYVFADDPDVSKREMTEILGYWNEYIGWSDTEYIKMLTEYKIFDNKFLRTYIAYHKF